MPTLRRLLARADRFLLLLIATVALAAILPARGAAVPVVEGFTTFAVALLFLLYGASCPTFPFCGKFVASSRRAARHVGR